MLLGLMGGLFFVKHEFAKDKHEFAKDKQERLAAGKPETRDSSH